MLQVSTIHHYEIAIRTVFRRPSEHTVCVHVSEGTCSQNHTLLFLHAENIPISIGQSLCFPRTLTDRVASRSPTVDARGSVFTLTTFLSFSCSGGPAEPTLPFCVPSFAVLVSQADVSISSSLTTFSMIGRFRRAVAPSVKWTKRKIQRRAVTTRLFPSFLRTPSSTDDCERFYVPMLNQEDCRDQPTNRRRSHYQWRSPFEEGWLSAPGSCYPFQSLQP